MSETTKPENEYHVRQKFTPEEEEQGRIAKEILLKAPLSCEPMLSRGASMDKFLSVMKCLDGKILITPEIMSEIIGIAARLEEIERSANRAEGKP